MTGPQYWRHIGWPLVRARPPRAAYLRASSLPCETVSDPMNREQAASSFFEPLAGRDTEAQGRQVARAGGAGQQPSHSAAPAAVLVRVFGPSHRVTANRERGVLLVPMVVQWTYEISDPQAFAKWLHTVGCALRSRRRTRWRALPRHVFRGERRSERAIWANRRRQRRKRNAMPDAMGRQPPGGDGPTVRSRAGEDRSQDDRRYGCR